MIAGPDQGGLQAKLQRQAEQAGIAGRIQWPGMIDGDLKWGALRACDALVLPSHSENFGIAVVESLAVSRPVLISNQVNIWRKIECDGAGFVEDDTQDGTERLLRRWFTLLPAERDAMAARTRACFEQHFTMKRTAVAIGQLFSSTSSSPGKGDGAGQVSKDATSLPNHELRT